MHQQEPHETRIGRPATDVDGRKAESVGIGAASTDLLRPVTSAQRLRA